MLRSTASSCAVTLPISVLLLLFLSALPARKPCVITVHSPRPEDATPPSSLQANNHEATNRARPVECHLSRLSASTLRPRRLAELPCPGQPRHRAKHPAAAGHHDADRLLHERAWSEVLLRAEGGEAEDEVALPGGDWDAIGGAVQLLDAVCLLGVLGFGEGRLTVWQRY